MADSVFATNSILQAPLIGLLSAKEAADLLPHIPIKAMLHSQPQGLAKDATMIDVKHPAPLTEINAIVGSVPTESLMAYLYWQVFRQTHRQWNTSCKGLWENLIVEV